MLDLLLEVGLEEIPAQMIAPAEAELARRVKELLVRERLAEAGASPDSANGLTVTSYSTPRRLAVAVTGILDRQLEVEENLTGPSWKVAFSGSTATAAAQAFAKKAGVAVSDLEKIVTPKGEYVAAKVRRPGESAADVLTAQLPGEIASLPWPKTMYWRAGKPERFIRPVRWLVCLLGGATLSFEFAGIPAGGVSYGHRILHGNAPVVIASSADYLPAMTKAFVMADAGARRYRIRKALDAAARSVPGIRWREDSWLLEQAVHLTEWPTAIRGNFDPEFLELPQEVLVTVMRDHQKYFALEDPEGRLAPYFLSVLNTDVDAEGLEIIRHGNSRVLRARFNDARFFWNYDQKIPLAGRVERLESVTFQKGLGSYRVKTEANLRAAGALADTLAAAGVSFDRPALETAVLLAKTDLTTELVKEFTELQGVIGGLYARAQGLGEAVAQAISSQYLPASQEDPIPPTIEGRILGLADRMMTIVEMFAVGLAPTGSKDPFALRRAANGVIKILAESELPVTLAQVEQIALDQSASIAAAGGGKRELGEAVSGFLRERLAFYLREVCGYSYDVVNAVLSSGIATVSDAVARARALASVRGSEDLLAISAAFKRIKNILRQAQEKAGPGEDLRGVLEGSAIAASDLVEPAERRLHDEAAELSFQVELLRARQDYPQALERIATLRPAIDDFFDHVMVMAHEAHLRKNRLSLIAWTLSNFSRIADFSEIVNDTARP